MKALSKTCSALDKVFKVFFYISGAVLFLTLFIAFYCVIVRFLGAPVAWSDELQRFLMITMVFTASPYLISEKGHLIVDLVDIFLPKKTKLKRVTHFIGDIILLAIIIYLIFPCAELTMKNTTSFSTALRLPMSVMYGLLPVTFAISAIAQIKNIIKLYVLGEKLVKDAVIEEI